MTAAVETNIPSLQDAHLAPVYVRMDQVPAEAAIYITQDMVKAKAGCRKCNGQGHRGHLAQSTYNPILRKHVAAGAAIPCTCLMVDVTALKAAIEAARLKLVAEEEAAKADIAQKAAKAEGEPNGA